MKFCQNYKNCINNREKNPQKKHRENTYCGPMSSQKNTIKPTTKQKHPYELVNELIKKFGKKEISEEQSKTVYKQFNNILEKGHVGNILDMPYAKSQEKQIHDKILEKNPSTYAYTLSYKQIDRLSEILNKSQYKTTAFNEIAKNMEFEKANYLISLMAKDEKRNNEIIEKHISFLEQGIKNEEIRELAFPIPGKKNQNQDENLKEAAKIVYKRRKLSNLPTKNKKLTIKTAIYISKAKFNDLKQLIPHMNIEELEETEKNIIEKINLKNPNHLKHLESLLNQYEFIETRRSKQEAIENMIKIKNKTKTDKTEILNLQKLLK